MEQSAADPRQLFAGPSWPEPLADLMRSLFERVISLPEIRAAAIFGSRARTDRPADQWADVDMLIVSDSASLRDSTGWLAEIRPIWVSLLQQAPLPNKWFWQVVFEGGLDFDVIMLEPGELQRLIDGEGGDEAFGHGMVILADKDGELADVKFRPAAPDEPPLLDADAFTFTISDLSMQLVYAVKHLMRGELWVAKAHLDGWLREIFLRLIRWDAHLRDPTVVTSTRGRRIEQWASPDACAALVATSATYEARSLAAALDAIIPNFRPLIERIVSEREFDLDRARLAAVEAWVSEQLASVSASARELRS